jgi:hypothetical protein
MNINDLKPGDKIETFKDSTFCLDYNFEFDISDLTWQYKVNYVDSNYVIINVLSRPGSSLYLLANCKSIEILK